MRRRARGSRGRVPFLVLLLLLFAVALAAFVVHRRRERRPIEPALWIDPAAAALERVPSFADPRWLAGLERVLHGCAPFAVEDRAALGALARELAATPAQLAIAWCLANPRVSTVILGATRAAQLQENLAALEVLPKLDASVRERIEAIVDNAPELPRQF